MARTRFDRLEIGSADRTGFQISGKLGFHENKKIEQLVQECIKREFKLVVFDFSELTSLGGGVAKILREFVKDLAKKGGEVVFVVKSQVVLDFLKSEDAQIRICSTLEEAVGGGGTVTAAQVQGKSDEVPQDAVPQDSGPAAAEDTHAAVSGARPDEAAEAATPGAQPRDGVILMSYDAGDGAETGSDAPQGPADGEAPGETVKISPAAEAPQRTEHPAGDQGIISEIFSQEASSQSEWIDNTSSPFNLSNEVDTEDPKELNRKLKRRILELKTLFSISADFNSIRERKKLLDIFLLTSIAQGGVESAVFFERREDQFVPSISKGIDENRLFPINLSENEFDRINGGRDVISIDNIKLDSRTAGGLKEAGLEYICPFCHSEGVTGLVLLGKRIAGRGMQKEDFEFMQILVNLAKGAYSNALMFERENERTLGIVKTLISLIEENTLLKGTSEIVSRYVGMLAKNMDYPEESFKDLIYGTVLRDMGMVKVSDLIVRSPRELTKEEWHIIKKHPEDGAEMLRRMKFSDHVVEIVLSHHERFNGEGYPRGLRGKEIPQGARIISVVESYAAMINERPNRPALSGREALDTLKENYGLRYDREIVNQFAAILEKELAKSVQPAGSVA